MIISNRILNSALCGRNASHPKIGPPIIRIGLKELLQVDLAFTEMVRFHKRHSQGKTVLTIVRRNRERVSILFDSFLGPVLPQERVPGFKVGAGPDLTVIAVRIAQKADQYKDAESDYDHPRQEH